MVKRGAQGLCVCVCVDRGGVSTDMRHHFAPTCQRRAALHQPSAGQVRCWQGLSRRALRRFCSAPGHDLVLSLSHRVPSASDGMAGAGRVILPGTRAGSAGDQTVGYPPACPAGGRGHRQRAPEHREESHQSRRTACRLWWKRSGPAATLTSRCRRAPLRVRALRLDRDDMEWADVDTSANGGSETVPPRDKVRR